MDVCAHVARNFVQVVCSGKSTRKMAFQRIDELNDIAHQRWLRLHLRAGLTRRSVPKAGPVNGQG